MIKEFILIFFKSSLLAVTIGGFVFLINWILDGIGKIKPYWSVWSLGVAITFLSILFKVSGYSWNYLIMFNSVIWVIIGLVYSISFIKSKEKERIVREVQNGT